MEKQKKLIVKVLFGVSSFAYLREVNGPWDVFKIKKIKK